MGHHFSKEPQDEDKLAQLMRRQNCKISKRIYKIIEEAFIKGCLSEFEFHSTIGWFHGMKFRHLKEKDEVFLIAIDKINDTICALIEERHNEKLQAREYMPLMDKTHRLTKDMAVYRQMLETSNHNAGNRFKSA